MSYLKNSGYPFGGRILNIAYSDIGAAPKNSAEHFQIAAHLGFNALKGDVRITADGGLVMCHDAGITLDENGRASLVNILRGDTYTADVSAEDGIVSVKNIAYTGSISGYDDGLPALLMNMLDYSLDVCCPENPEARIFWDGKALRLDTGNRDGMYRIHVSV